MKRVLFIGIHRPGRSPSQRYRYEQFEPYFAQAGYHTTYSYSINAEDDLLYYSAGNLLGKLGILQKSLIVNLSNVIRAQQYDLIFIQREAFMLGTAVFERLLAATGVPIVFDFDDAIWMPNVSEGNKNLAFLKNPLKTNRIIKLATSVIAGNEFLANYALQFNPNVLVVPSTVDAKLYCPKPSQNPDSPEPVCIGWSGSASTLPYLEAIMPQLAEVEKALPRQVRFLVIGVPGYRNSQLNRLHSIAWRADTEVPDLAQLDIGLMPLPNEPWAQGKCGMKAIQYMGLGIPAVVSPIGVNTTIVQHLHNGMWATEPKDWQTTLVQLVQNRAIRETLGANARKTVEERYSLQSQLPKLVAHFDRLTQ
jgi:glycosyltransferase involved in cell wall biosynthesis